MKNNVVLSIRGTQTYEGQEPDVIELVTEGTMEFRAGGWDISYEESELTGLAGVTTTFRVEAGRVILERTPPELSADIYDRGIVVVGGAANLKGIGRAIGERMGVRTIIPKNPALAVCAGLGRMLESANDFSEFVKYKG